MILPRSSQFPLSIPLRRLQRDGFLRLSALGLDMDLLRLEAAQAFQAFQAFEALEAQEPEAQPEARMLRSSMRWGALETWRISGWAGMGRSGVEWQWREWMVIVSKFLRSNGVHLHEHSPNISKTGPCC